MLRITELKLPLTAVPVEALRVADAPPETDADRAPTPHPVEALKILAAQTLGIGRDDIATLTVFKRSFDARKAELLVVYIVDLALAHPDQQAALLQRIGTHPHIGPTPDMAYHLVGACANRGSGRAPGHRGLWPLRHVRSAAAGANGL